MCEEGEAVAPQEGYGVPLAPVLAPETDYGAPKVYTAPTDTGRD